MYHILPRRIKAGLIVAMALAVLLLPGDRVQADGPADSIIHACVNANGNLRVVGANASPPVSLSCPTGRTLRHWSLEDGTLGGQPASSYARRDTANNFTSGDQTIAGNVGIGTTAPTAALTITKSSAPAHVLSDGMELGMVSASRSWIQSYGGRPLVLNELGNNVGIGTNSPAQALDVVGNIWASANIGVGSTPNQGDIHIRKVVPGGTVRMFIENASNLPGANAKALIQVGGFNANDPMVHLSVSGASDWTVGIDNSDSDKFKISESAGALGTNDRLTIDSSGNVGIGTTSPVEKLDVAGNVRSSGAFRGGSGSQIAPTYSFTDAPNSGMFRSPDGSVRISVVGTPTVRFGSGAVDITGSDLILSGSSRFAGDTLGLGVISPPNRLSVAGAAAVGSTFASSGAPLNGLIVEGNVGIGTTSPNNLESIVGLGGTNLQVYKSNAEARVIVSASTYANLSLDSRGAAANQHLWAVQGNTDGSLQFQTYNDVGVLTGAPLTILNGGNVGIGTTTPGARLAVAGGDAATTGAGNGLIVKSPDGLICRRVGIDNAGALLLTAVACP